MSEPVDFIRTHGVWLAIETERWIWKAIAQGVGNRVWRSRPLARDDPPMTVFYDFKIIKPGDELPDVEGFIMGPFSQ